MSDHHLPTAEELAQKIGAKPLTESQKAHNRAHGLGDMVMDRATKNERTEMPSTCETCKWFAKSDSYYERGWCFLNPPIPDRSNDLELAKSWVRPIVFRNDFCRHHEGHGVKFTRVPLDSAHEAG